MEDDSNNKTLHATGDYGLIAFLSVLKRIKPLADRTRKVRRGKMEYVYAMTEADWTALRIEYSNSIFPVYLEEIKRRKDPSF